MEQIFSSSLWFANMNANLLYKHCGQLHILTNRLKRLFFLPLNSLGTLVENQHVCENLFLGSLFYSIGLYVCLMLVQYRCFAVSFSVRKRESSNFIVLCQDCIDYSGSFAISYEFEGWLFHFCQKDCWNFGRDYIDSVYCFERYCHLNNIKSSIPCLCLGVLKFHLFRSSLISFSSVL